MNDVLGLDSALERLYWAGDNQVETEESQRGVGIGERAGDCKNISS